MKKLIISLVLLSATLMVAQTLPTEPTNTPSIFVPLNYLTTLWPNIDRSATNSFKAKELYINSSALWKTATASGSTPYLDMEGGYFLTKNFGVGGELITLGSGQGNQAIDTFFATFTLRKDIGNLAAYLLASGGYQIVDSSAIGAVGVGIVYAYPNGLRTFVDTRISFEGLKGNSSSDYGWLTRVGVQWKF